MGLYQIVLRIYMRFVDISCIYNQLLLNCLQAISQKYGRNF